MDRTSTNTYHPSTVSPPGETLRDILDERGITQHELATRMGRPEKTISEIMRGKAAITPETAIQLEYVLGVPASFWNSRESHYREYLSRLNLQSMLEDEVAWMRTFPIKKMVDYGWIDRADDEPGQVRELLQFYGVTSSTVWSEWQEVSKAVFRKSRVYEGAPFAVSAWLRQGEREAREIPTATYGRAAFKEALTRIRSITRDAPEVFISQMRQWCAQSGVVLVLVPQLPNTSVSGAARWLSPSRALIQLSLRFKTDDHFWFSFFHEAAHILLHSKRAVFLDDEKSGNGEQIEAEADRFASDFLIPPADYRSFRESTPFSKAGIAEFAARLGIAPGIVVGRLQHDGLLPFNHCNGLKRRFEWGRGSRE